MIFAGSLNAHTPDPVELFASFKMETLLQEAKTRYDFILIDSPCIKWFREPLVLAPISDGVFLVIEANHTPKRVILMASDKINALGGQIKGVLLNKQTNYVPEIFQNFLY